MAALNLAAKRRLTVYVPISCLIDKDIFYSSSSEILLNKCCFILVTACHLPTGEEGEIAVKSELAGNELKKLKKSIN